MAGSSLFTLIDDIASVLDDVAILSKVAAKKTSGVLGDDLALNAQQVSGIQADRELPVVWAVAKGSAINKLILVPVALLLSAFLPKLIPVLLMLGGLFLCYEGSEKVIHAIFKNKDEENQHHKEHLQHLRMTPEELIKYEQDKIKGAIRTDFILSAEIIVITLGTVSQAPLSIQIGVLTGISSIMTVGVYGLVAVIVKLDDLGLYLTKSTTNSEGQFSFKRKTGEGLLKMMPYFMKSLSILGTAAMFLVGGGILTHEIHTLHLIVEGAGDWGFLINGLIGALAGLVVVGIISSGKKVLKR